MKKLGAVLAALTATLIIVAPAAARGGGGTVTALGVGPLRFDYSTSDDVEAWAGSPDKVSYTDQYGAPTNPDNATYATEEFHYPGNGYTYYSFWWDGSEWLFEQFDTSLQRFQTIRGSKVGMSYGQARRREKVPWTSGCWSGFRHDHQLAGQSYEVLVDVYVQGKRVNALDAFGPHPPFSC
jgi:hypothetical protein